MEHRGVARPGEDVAAEYRAGTDSPSGWSMIPSRYEALFQGAES